MKKPLHAVIFVSLFFILAVLGYLLSRIANTPAIAENTPSGRYALIAWNDLGMHCMDNHYAVFSILPPYNNLRAQLIDRLTGKPVKTGITVT